MSITVFCPHCNQVLKADEHLFGKRMRCPSCNKGIEVPDPNGGTAQAAPPPDPLKGKQFAHYRIEGFLGKGAMGRVYKAINVRLDKTCAIKILPPDFAQQDPSKVDRFIREAQSAAKVEHPNVLPVQNVGREGECYYIEMQFVDGGSLDDLLKQKGKLNARQAARIMRDVADGLQAAHEKHIIHRDVKPSNVMLTKMGQTGLVGRAMVADFGLAKMAQASAVLTSTGAILGTPAYMSPEQVSGRPADHRTDIYSMGVMFYQLLTGELPFSAESLPELLEKHKSAPIPNVTDLAPETPRRIAAMLRKMMAKPPAGRYQSSDEISKELGRFLQVRFGSRSFAGSVLKLLLLAVVAVAVIYFMPQEQWRKLKQYTEQKLNQAREYSTDKLKMAPTPPEQKQPPETEIVFPSVPEAQPPRKPEAPQALSRSTPPGTTATVDGRAVELSEAKKARSGAKVIGVSNGKILIGLGKANGIRAGSLLTVTRGKPGAPAATHMEFRVEQVFPNSSVAVPVEDTEALPSTGDLVQVKSLTGE